MIINILLTFIATILHRLVIFRWLFGVDGEEIIDFGKHLYIIRFKLMIGFSRDDTFIIDTKYSIGIDLYFGVGCGIGVSVAETAIHGVDGAGEDLLDAFQHLDFEGVGGFVVDFSHEGGHVAIGAHHERALGEVDFV
jgi:hypothetical protein